MDQGNFVSAQAEVVVAGKPFYHSKTFWVNAIAALAMLCQSQWGFLMDASAQAVVISVINLILRSVTDSAIVWGK